MRTGEPPRGPGGRFEHLSPRPLAPVVGAASQNRHDSNHEETGKGDPLWGSKAALPVRPIHGGFGGHPMVIWSRFTVFWVHGDFFAWGARNSGAPWTGTPTLPYPTV